MTRLKACIIIGLMYKLREDGTCDPEWTRRIQEKYNAWLWEN